MSERPPSEGEFRVQDVLGSAQAIYLESVHMPGYLISFDENGVPGDEAKLKTKDKGSQFEIQLVNNLLILCCSFFHRICLFFSP